MTLEEVEVIREMFALMDSDGDGKISYDELKTGLRKVGSQLAEAEMKLLMDVVNITILLNTLKQSFVLSSFWYMRFTSLICQNISRTYFASILLSFLYVS